MPLIDIELTFDEINTSAQVGDIAYYSYNVNTSGGFSKSKISTTLMFGPIVLINGNKITVRYNEGLIPASTIMDDKSFISFAKDKKINTTSLSGYYAEAKFVNDSTDKVELFSVGSEVAESSK